ncbi:MAG: tetratricopeptide repeat protein, partial [Saprospiraceae bacterium]|nr:tetratricopeptide repeat protein [Saprospiraceae bacterium]
EILKAEGNLAEAKTEYQRIKRQFPNDVVAQNGYAEILKAEGNLAEAKTEYQRIKRQFPNDIVAQNGYAEILKAEGNLAEAKTEYQRIKKQFPDNIVAQTGYAEILKAEGNLAEAKTEYQRILELRPNDQVALHALHSLLLVLNEPITNAPSIPTQPQTAQDFYWLYFHITKLMKEGDWAEAQKLTTFGVETCNFYNLKLLFKRTRKYILLQTREFAAAIADLNDYLENHPVDHILQTHAYAELNQVDSAKRELKKSVQFKGIPLIFDTACLLSEKYAINGLPKSNPTLSPDELTRRIREYEYQALVLV